MTFSIMKSNRLIIGELFVDSMIVNLKKDKSALLSEESNSEVTFKFFVWICHVYYFFCQFCASSPHGVQVLMGICQGGSPFL